MKKYYKNENNLFEDFPAEGSLIGILIEPIKITFEFIFQLIKSIIKNERNKWKNNASRKKY
jgi:hypothetical protein